MGEDFLRKQSDRFVRTRNRGFSRLVEQNIFTGNPVNASLETTGTQCGEPQPPGTRVLPHVHSDGSVAFYRGDLECARVPQSRAKELNDLVRGGTVVGVVVSTDPDLGHVRLRLTPMDGG
jgi:hypothetical protein